MLIPGPAEFEVQVGTGAPPRIAAQPDDIPLCDRQFVPLGEDVDAEVLAGVLRGQAMLAQLAFQPLQVAIYRGVAIGVLDVDGLAVAVWADLDP